MTAIVLVAAVAMCLWATILDIRDWLRLQRLLWPTKGER